MKIAIYISFIIGFLVLIIGVILTLIRNRKITKIIDSYNEKRDNSISIEQGKAQNKGWGMNNSPFKTRKSGLTWGGGNIKASNATRGTRRSFLK